MWSRLSGNWNKCEPTGRIQTALLAMWVVKVLIPLRNEAHKPTLSSLLFMMKRFFVGWFVWKTICLCYVSAQRNLFHISVMDLCVCVISLFCFCFNSRGIVFEMKWSRTISGWGAFYEERWYVRFDLCWHNKHKQWKNLYIYINICIYASSVCPTIEYRVTASLR